MGWCLGHLWCLYPAGFYMTLIVKGNVWPTDCWTREYHSFSLILFSINAHSLFVDWFFWNDFCCMLYITHGIVVYMGHWDKSLQRNNASLLTSSLISNCVCPYASLSTANLPNRRYSSHPHKVTTSPTSELRSSPHVWLRSVNLLIPWRLHFSLISSYKYTPGTALYFWHLYRKAVNVRLKLLWKSTVPLYVDIFQSVRSYLNTEGSQAAS